MADETWPTTLPQYVDRGSFAYALSSSSISTGMSTGYDKRRRRFTGQYAEYTVSMQVTADQANTFEQFFNNNLGYGVILFDFPDPLFIEDSIEVRIKAGSEDNPYTFTPYGESDDLILSMILERLISSFSTVSVESWPTTLPQCPLNDGYSTETQSGIVRDADKTKGVINTRRRFTAVIRKHSVTFIMDRDQLEIFINFYGSLGYGALAFTAPYPLIDGDTMRTRFDTTSGFGYTLAYYNDTDLFVVSFVWEELPTLQGF